MNLNMFLLANIVLSKGSLNAQIDYFTIFSFYTFDTPFFAQYRSKKSREGRTAELADFKPIFQYEKFYCGKSVKPS